MIGCEINMTLSVSGHKHMKSVRGWTWPEVTGVVRSHVTSSLEGSSSWAQRPIFSCINTNTQMKHRVSHNNICLSLTLAKEKKRKKNNTHSLGLDHQHIQSRNIAITCIRWNTNRKYVVYVINVLMLVCTSVYYVWELLSENYIIKCVLIWLLKAQSLTSNHTNYSLFTYFCPRGKILLLCVF